MIPFSVLDLSPITQGSHPATSFKNTLALAQLTDTLGFHRYWMAEHHGMEGIASAATALLISHVAAHTNHLRVGAGGIMLPNHAPLVIAEQFGTLEALYPDRIDLGLGRAPGSDQTTARALRRNLSSSPDDFPRDVLELIDYLSDEPDQPVHAIPGRGANVPIWILGSSLFGAQLAAALGLPYAFASHFAPRHLMQAIDVYRSTFKPSEHLDKPYVMLGFNVFAADSNEHAHYLASSAQQYIVQLRTGKPGQIPPPVANFYENSSPEIQALIQHATACSAIGDADTVTENIRQFIEITQADELIITSNIYDHHERLHSYEILADVYQRLNDDN